LGGLTIRKETNKTKQNKHTTCLKDIDGWIDNKFVNDTLKKKGLLELENMEFWLAEATIAKIIVVIVIVISSIIIIISILVCL